MQKSIAAASILLLALFAAAPAFAQAAAPSEAARETELTAAWVVASKAGTAGPADIALLDQATLKLPVEFFFVPKAEGGRVLRALGNVIYDASLVGLVVGRRENDQWIVVIRNIREGYIKDDDAKNWNADELLKSIKNDVDEANKDRVTRGFTEMQVIGWAEPPNYDAATHRLVWSLLASGKGQPDSATKNINYNTYALGRDGYFSLNLVTTSDRIAAEKSVAHRLLENLSYNAGKRYEDFSAATDRVAEYGLLALIGGVAAKKLGLFAIILAFVLKFAKVFALGAAAFGAGVVQFFRRKPSSGSTDSAA